MDRANAYGLHGLVQQVHIGFPVVFFLADGDLLVQIGLDFVVIVAANLGFQLPKSFFQLFLITK